MEYLALEKISLLNRYFLGSGTNARLFIRHVFHSDTLLHRARANGNEQGMHRFIRSNEKIYYSRVESLITLRYVVPSMVNRIKRETLEIHVFPYERHFDVYV